MRYSMTCATAANYIDARRSDLAPEMISGRGVRRRLRTFGRSLRGGGCHSERAGAATVSAA